MKKNFLRATAAVVAVAAFAACSRVQPPPEVPAGALFAIADGYIDWVSVELVMDGNNIVDVIVDMDRETPMWQDMIRNSSLIADIIAANGTAGVANVAGATGTARAIKEAVNEILAGLGHDVPELPVDTGNDDAEPAEIVHVLPAEGPYTATVTGWAQTGRVPDATPGEYPIGVRVNFAAGNERIESIDFYPNQETPMFVGMVHPLIIDQIIARQSTEGIDTANSGATVTANAILEAVQIVLDRHNFVAPEAGEEPPVEQDEPPAEQPPAEQPPAETGGGTPPPPEPTGRFIPGAHRGTSNNTYSHQPDNEGGLTPTPLVIEVVLTDNDVTSVTIVSHGESGPWAGPMTQGVRDAIVANNGTAGVNIAPGATYTSRAIIEAAGLAIAAGTR